MPRRIRIQDAGLLHHVISRGNDRQQLFLNKDDFNKYISLLEEGRSRFSIKIYNYCLMHNHVHMLLEPQEEGALSKFMEFVSKDYAKFFNKKYGRTGHVFQGRFKSFIIQSEKYFLACTRYIDLNPVDAGIVKDAKEYQWSAYSQLAHGEKAPLTVDVHDQYKDYGSNDSERQIVYRALVSKAPGENLDLMNRRAGVLGTKEFKAEIKQKS